jgi:TM2 domain-containing membrane protein YozV
MKKRKNPILASVLSAFVFAGAGQIYNKQYKKGVVLLISYGTLLVLTLKPIVLGYIDYLRMCANIESVDISKINTQFIPTPDLTFSILMAIIWLFAVSDAYISAKKYNSELEKQ